MTDVILLRDGQWLALWQGRMAKATFNSKGAAWAWIACCETAGQFRY